MESVSPIGATKFVVEQFLKKKDEFAYVRRYKKELQEAVPNFFNAINRNNEFPNHNLSFNGKKFICDSQICGHALTLSTSQDLKSTNFDNVKTIIFDEVFIEEGQKKYYLKNEVFVFLNLLETIARLRDVRVFLLSNAVSINNPYFTYFDLHIPFNGEIKLFNHNTILLQYLKSAEYEKIKQKSRIGLLTKDTEYADYAFKNKFLHDSSTFIEKKTASAKFTFAFIFENKTYGVWFDYLNRSYFC